MITSIDANKIVLLTGASSGIGRDLAICFAKKGFKLILVGRNASTLNELKTELEKQFNCQVNIIIQDLSITNAAYNIFAQLMQDNIEVDILVNCAGLGASGDFNNIDWELQQEILQLNIFTPTHLIKLILPGMLQRKYGKILNVSSFAGFFPGPFENVYFAAKSYLISFSLALYEELRGTDVNVTVLCPGPTLTNFFKGNLRYNRIYTSNILPKLSSQLVAENGFKGLFNNCPIVIPGLFYKLFVLFSPLIPTRLKLIISRYLAKPNRP